MTSTLFPDAKFSEDRLKGVLDALNSRKSKLVIDLSCRRKESRWIVAMNKWQTLTDMDVNEGTLILRHAVSPIADSLEKTRSGTLNHSALSFSYTPQTTKAFSAVSTKSLWKS